MSRTNYAALHVNRSGESQADTDSNGFRKSRRDVAVDLFRKAGACLLSGAAHLALLARAGMKDVSDGVYQFTTPALGNSFWRSFCPARPGAEWILGNPFPVFAVANLEARHLLACFSLYYPKLLSADGSSHYQIDESEVFYILATKPQEVIYRELSIEVA